VWSNRGRKPNYSEKDWPFSTLPTTNPSWPDRAWTQATAMGSQRLSNSLSYGTANTTSNYGAIANSPALQFTTARTEFSQAAMSSPMYSASVLNVHN
jgi:hypothetical protein